MPRHPKNSWISNTLAAPVLIFLTRHRLPVVSRVFAYFLGCEIGLALPKTVFLPRPLGIVIHSGARIGDNVVIGRQVTLGGRDLTSAAPQVEESLHIGANAVITKDVSGGATVIGANRLLPKPSPYALD